MKRLLALSVVLISITACTRPPTTPALTYPYNPNVNSTEQNDARVPYRGDWAFAALLADGTSRTGVASILTRFSTTGLVNAGGGVAAWCLTAGCATSDEQGTVLFGTTGTGASAQLSIGMVPKNQTFTRFVMSDTDGVVSLNNGKATISGVGTWRDAAGMDQTATFGFVQVSTKSALDTQSVTDSAQQLAARAARTEQLRAESVTPGLSATFTGALVR